MKNENSIASVDKDLGRLNCEECGTIAEEMYLTEESFLVCYECAGADMRRKNLREAEKEFNEFNNKEIE